MIPAHEAPLAIRRVSFRPGRAICHLVKSSITIEAKPSTNEDGHRGRSLERVGSFAARPRVWLAPGMALSPALRLPYALTSRIYGTPYFSHQLWSPLASTGVHFSAEFSGLAPIQNPEVTYLWNANVRPYVVAVKTLSQYIVLII
jgi:hypothetical protein